MNNSRPTSALIVMLWLTLGSLTLLAQADKVTITLTPKPNQTNHLRITHDLDLEIVFDGTPPPELAAMGQMKIVGKIITAFTRKVGLPDAQGRLTAETAYDQMSMDMAMNGNPLPIGDIGASVAGKKFTVIYDQQGKIVDVKMPSDLGVPADTIKQMLSSFSSYLPQTSMSVGETATVPLNMNLPIPIPGTNGLNLEGQTKSKLVSLTKDGADRLAKFDQLMEVKLASAIELPGNIKMNIDLKMNGTGTTELNVDKNLIKNSQMQNTIDATINMVGDVGGTQLPNIKLRGTFKTVIGQTN